MIRDKHAERLEQAGLWRRAAHRWLEVMDACPDTLIKEYILIRRRQCLAIAAEGIPRLKKILMRRYYLLWKRSNPANLP